MAFGFFKRDKGPREVVCPLCENRQEESSLAVSTFCKRCHAHLNLEGKEVIAHARETTAELIEREVKPTPADSKVSSKTPAQPNLTKLDQPKSSSSLGNRRGKLPPRPKPPLLQERQVEPNEGALKNRKLPKPPLPPAPAGEKSEFEKVEPTEAPTITAEEEKPFEPREAGPDDRMVLCFDCPTEHPTSKNSTSALCPKCGAYISLKDFDIKDGFNSRIQTRGQVTIHKKGVVSSSIIQCHDLIVEGEFTGSAECSGNLTIRRHSRIEGKVSCQKLRIEKRAKVEFLQEVIASSCEIDGLVKGDILCRGRLALHKKASLQGDIRVGTLSVDEGAKHDGQISMGSFPE